MQEDVKQYLTKLEKDRGKKMNGKLKLDLKLLELPKRKIYLSVSGGSYCVD